MLTTQSIWLSRPNSADDSPKTTHLHRIVDVLRIVNRFTPIIKERRRSPTEPLQLASPVARRDTLYKRLSRIAKLRHHPVIYDVDDIFLDLELVALIDLVPIIATAVSDTSPVHEEVNGAPTVEFPPSTEENHCTALVCPKPHRHRSQHRDEAHPVQIVPYQFIYASLKIKSSHRHTKNQGIKCSTPLLAPSLLYSSGAVVSNNDNIVIVIFYRTCYYYFYSFGSIFGHFSKTSLFWQRS
jgi:hypothetical protein